MSLTDEDEIHAVIAAVNEGIDAYLEACYCPDRGDRYEGGNRKAGKLVFVRPWNVRQSRISACSSSPLVRIGTWWRSRSSGRGQSACQRHPMVLGINEYGEFVGREILV